MSDTTTALLWAGGAIATALALLAALGVQHHMWKVRDRKRREALFIARAEEAAHAGTLDDLLDGIDHIGVVPDQPTPLGRILQEFHAEADAEALRPGGVWAEPDPPPCDLLEDKPGGPPVEVVTELPASDIAIGPPPVRRCNAVSDQGEKCTYLPGHQDRGLPLHDWPHRSLAGPVVAPQPEPSRPAVEREPATLTSTVQYGSAQVHPQCLTDRRDARWTRICEACRPILLGPLAKPLPPPRGAS